VDGPPSRLVFQPRNRVDSVATLNVLVIDIAGHARLRAARANARTARATKDEALVTTEQQVATAYHRCLGGVAMRRAAEAGVASAEANAKLVGDRRENGVASSLDVARSDAAAERARTDLAEAALGVDLALRQLRDLSPPMPT